MPTSATMTIPFSTEDAAAAVADLRTRLGEQELAVPAEALETIQDWLCQQLEARTVEPPPNPTQALLRNLREDREYLMGWHANLAVVTSDAIRAAQGPIASWRMGQDAARRFMSTLFAGEPNAPVPISDDEVRHGLSDTPGVGRVPEAQGKEQ